MNSRKERIHENLAPASIWPHFAISILRDGRPGYLALVHTLLPELSEVIVMSTGILWLIHNDIIFCNMYSFTLSSQHPCEIDIVSHFTDEKTKEQGVKQLLTRWWVKKLGPNFQFFWCTALSSFLQLSDEMVLPGNAGRTGAKLEDLTLPWLLTYEGIKTYKP